MGLSENGHKGIALQLWPCSSYNGLCMDYTFYKLDYIYSVKGLTCIDVLVNIPYPVRIALEGHSMWEYHIFRHDNHGLISATVILRHQI